MGWASGFRAGSDVAARAIDIYRRAQQEQELADIKNAKAETVDGYTAEQGEQLENVTRAINPETGKPYYQVEAIPGSAQYQVKPNFEGAEGTVSPQRVTDYLGRRYQGELSPEQQERARYRAMADVVSKQDPIAGAKMRLAITQDERAEKEFAQNSTMREMQIEEQNAIKQAGEEMKSFASEAMKFAQENGIPAAVAKFGFNVPGVNISLSTGADGQAVANVLDPKGKVTQQIPLTQENYMKYIGQLAQQRMIDRLGEINPRFLFQGAELGLKKDELGLRREDLGVKREGLDIERAFKGPGGTWERVNRYEADTKNATARYVADKGAEGRAKPEVSNDDVREFVRDMGDQPSDIRDPKTDQPLRINQVPLADQRRLALEFYTGRAGNGGLPDVPKGGLKSEKPKKGDEPKGNNKYEGQKFGILTPQRMIDEAAANGNPDAIRYKQRQEQIKADRANAPLNTGIPY